MPTPTKRPTLYILDGHSIVFQVYHAIPEMTSPTGEPTNATYGFTRDIFNLIKSRNPDFLICTFDTPAPTFRHTMYDAYKANRGSMPDDLRPQIKTIHELLNAFEIPVFEQDGFEADDLIATIATRAEQEQFSVYIVSSDKDCRQLISSDVQMYNLRKEQTFDNEALKQDWGITSEQVVDLLAMTGDNVDNVPGIPGIGIKTASKLLQQYETLDGIIQHVEEISGPKKRQQIKESVELVRRSQQLVSLDRNVPLEINWEQCRLSQKNNKQLLTLFNKLGFHRFAEQTQKEEAPPEWTGVYHLVQNPDDLHQVVDDLASSGHFSLELVTNNKPPMHAELLGIGLSWQPGTGWYIPLREAAKKQKTTDKQTARALWDMDNQDSTEEIWNHLRPTLENPDIHKTSHDLKSSIIVLRRHGIQLKGLNLDTGIASYLLNAGERIHTLEQLSLLYLKSPLESLKQLQERLQADHFDALPDAMLANYIGRRVDTTLRAAKLLETELRKQKLWTLYFELERPLIPVLAEMEYAGILVDTEVLTAMSSQYQNQLSHIEKEVSELAGYSFNLSSPQQLRKVLFDEIGLKSNKKTSSGALSTDQEVLLHLSKTHPLPALVVEHRKLSKLKNTYLDPLPALVHPETERIHATFNQNVTATGRLSSSDPNLQNIPIRTEQGRQIRRAFVPRDNWLLLTADYSQIELRVLAHLSQDPTLCDAFKKGRDIHTFVASQIHSLPEDEVTSEMRRTAKMVNFGIIYGLSSFGLSTRLDISREEAEVYIDAYFSRYPEVEVFSDKILEIARKTGYVSTVLGRRRSINGIRPETQTSRQRNLPERTAINTVIQGSAADLIKQAMIDIEQSLQEQSFRSRMLLQIHDELIFETPPEEIQALSTLTRQRMIQALPLEVPVTDDLAYGPNWLDVEPIKNGL